MTNPKLYVFNPLSYPFTTTFAVESGKSKKIVLPSERITELDDDYFGDRVVTDLVTAILNERNITHFDVQRDKVRKEILKEL